MPFSPPFLREKKMLLQVTQKQIYVYFLIHGSVSEAKNQFFALFHGEPMFALL